jgi:hypothetical protein
VTAQLAAVAGPDSVAGDELAVLRGVLRPDFLARAGWDAVAQVLAPVRGDPLLSLRECAGGRLRRFCRASAGGPVRDVPHAVEGLRAGMGRFPRLPRRRQVPR